MELEFMRETGGYKAILQAVLKTQIKTLIEQLYDETGTESLFLMHSKDNSLSHLGSYGGQQFLAEQNDIKSQFLGYFQNDASFKKVTKHKMPFKDTEPAAKRQRTQTAEKATNPDAQQQNKHSNTNIMVQSSSHSIKTVHKNKDQTSDTVTVHQNKDQATDNVDTESNEAEMEEQNYLSRDSSVEHTSPQPVIKVENVEGEDLAMTCVSVSENADHFNSDTEDDDDSKSIDGESHEDGNDTGETKGAQKGSTCVGSEQTEADVFSEQNSSTAQADMITSTIIHANVASDKTKSFSCQERLHNSKRKADMIDKSETTKSSEVKNQISCEHCEKQFSDHRESQSHMQVCSENSILVDEDIDKTNIDKSNIVNFGEDKNKRQRCHACCKMFLNKTILDKHALSCNPGLMQCPNCDKVFSQVIHLKEHFLSHAEQLVEKKFPCTQCDKVFYHLGHLKTHFVTHLDPVLKEHRRKEIAQAINEQNVGLKCDYMYSDGSTCEKVSSTRHNLERHMDTHFDRVKQFACKQCPKRYYRKEHLREHVEINHSQSPPSIPCRNCKKTFTHKRGLRSHLVYCKKR